MVTDDIAALLEASVEEIALASNLFIDRDGDDPSIPVQLSVYEVPGQASLLTQQDPLGIQRPMVQIAVKGLVSADARRLAEKAHQALSVQAHYNAKLGPDETFYLSIAPESTPHLLGRDQNDQTTYGFNVRIQKYASPAPTP